VNVWHRDHQALIAPKPASFATRLSFAKSRRPPLAKSCFGIIDIDIRALVF